MGLFEDLRTSAMKGGVSYVPKDWTVPSLEFAPFADGTVSAALKDGNDFAVMERGICSALFPDDPSGSCGKVFPGEF